MVTPAGMGEFDVIDRLLKPLAKGFPGALGLADDAALVDVPDGRSLVIAKDAIVEGVHFLADDPPEAVAAKLLRVNLSDLAAMGATPLAYLTVIARPKSLDDAWLEGFVAGLAADQKNFGLHLIGGDLVSTPGPLLLSCTILGLVPEGRALTRKGARAGDHIWVSGTLGDAALGLRVLKGLAATEDEAFYLVERYRRPQPRTALGPRLVGLAHAAIDVSDGLVADLTHILDESAAAATVDADALPLSPVAHGMPGCHDAALVGGDDYELLFTAPDAATPAIEALAGELGVALTRIGRIAAGQGLTVTDGEGRKIALDGLGWRHF
ncbi:MAG: thiamine-phosphate kinase [Geminicoccaceae bacterium]|nr:thiamine-phosphate kinase [Geminicoccaceae bacterium]